jgi:hypothetical protein
MNIKPGINKFKICKKGLARGLHPGCGPIHRVADLVAFEHFFERGRENHPRHRSHLQATERG